MLSELVKYDAKKSAGLSRDRARRDRRVDARVWSSRWRFSRLSRAGKTSGQTFGSERMIFDGDWGWGLLGEGEWGGPISKPSFRLSAFLEGCVGKYLSC